MMREPHPDGILTIGQRFTLIENQLHDISERLDAIDGKFWALVVGVGGAGWTAAFALVVFLLNHKGGH